jgi:hypothetical protein
MASKKSTHSSDAAMDAALLTGADAIKDGFEKAVNTYDQFLAFGKDNAEAVLKSANAAGKAVEVINSEVFAYTRKFFEDGVSATKAVLSAKMVEEAFALQSEYGKSLFQSQVEEAAKIGELTLSAARDTAEPFQARVAAAAELARQ